MSDEKYYAILGGALVVALLLMLLAVDFATRGGDRRAEKRARKAARAGIELPRKPPVLRVVPKRQERDRW